jgi:phthalate 4,5-dioxygenase
MLSRDDNDLMCRVEGDAPMGAVLRRFWLPACLVEEISQAGERPLRLTLLGQKLIAWRSANGQTSVMREGCPHRGASLALARDEGDGLRCIYHGWKIDPLGNILETPAEPKSSKICGQHRHKAYPSYEAGGMLWTFLGDGDPPPRTMFHWMEYPPTHYMVRKFFSRANFVQVMEGVFDSSHSDYLHSSQTQASASHSQDTVQLRGGRFRPSADRSPTLEVHVTDFGFVYGAIRKAAADPDRLSYVRCTAYAMPIFSFVPPNHMLAFVPVADSITAMYHVTFDVEGPLTSETIQSQEIFNGLRMGFDIQPDYWRRGNEMNFWLQDRSAMRTGDNFTGITGTIAQDVAVTESMGPIQDRSLEYLGAGDRAIVRLRRILLDSARAIRNDPNSMIPALQCDFRQVRSAAGIIPRNEDWWLNFYGSHKTSAAEDGPALEERKS